MNEVIRAALTSALDIDFDSPLMEIARVFEEGCRKRQIAEGYYLGHEGRITIGVDVAKRGSGSTCVIKCVRNDDGSITVLDSFERL